MNLRYLEVGGNPIGQFAFFIYPKLHERLRLKPMYSDLACSACGKLDEYAALRKGLAVDVRINPRKDFARTLDRCICVSQRFRSLYAQHGWTGLELVNCPSSTGALVRPTHIVGVDPAQSGMTFIGKACASCGRYKESCFSPRYESFMDPVPEGVFASPNLRVERGLIRFTELVVSETVANVLLQEEVTGLDWKAMGLK